MHHISHLIQVFPLIQVNVGELQSYESPVARGTFEDLNLAWLLLHSALSGRYRAAWMGTGKRYPAGHRYHCRGMACQRIELHPAASGCKTDEKADFLRARTRIYFLRVGWFLHGMTADDYCKRRPMDRSWNWRKRKNVFLYPSCESFTWKASRQDFRHSHELCWAWIKYVRARHCGKRAIIANPLNSGGYNPKRKDKIQGQSKLSGEQ